MKTMICIPETEYLHLTHAASVPPLPSSGPGLIPLDVAAKSALALSLVRERRQHGWSQAALAERAGVRQETISRIESGKHRVGPKTLKKIADALNRKDVP
jgi:DNA-binding XRE family transcriptional regulator